jgi:hypothetical protein
MHRTGATKRSIRDAGNGMDVSTVNEIRGRAPLRGNQALRAALRDRGDHDGTISFLYSPKTNLDLIVTSDLEFLHLLHLEGDPDVEWFDLDTDRIVTYLDHVGYIGSKPDARVRLRSGQEELVEVKYKDDLENDLRTHLQISAQQKKASEIGLSWSSYTEVDAAAEDRLLHDWLHIIVVLGQTRDYVHASLENLLYDTSGRCGPRELKFFESVNKKPWDLVFSAIFRLVQRGLLLTDLDKQPLSWRTVIQARG